MTRNPWGATTPTRLARLDADCAVVVQRLADAGTATRTVRNARALAAAGLPAAVPIGDERGSFVAWRLADGTPGPLLLGTAEGEWLALAMGRLARRIAELPAESFTVDPAWRTAGDLHRAATGWLNEVSPERPDVGGLREQIGRAIDHLSAAAWLPRPTHGDFAPANVIVREGRIVALIDVADLALRHPDLDIAWWELVVGFHHPGDVARLTRSLREGYAARDAGLELRLRSVAIARALQLAASSGDSTRPHALDLLIDATAVQGR